MAHQTDVLRSYEELTDWPGGPAGLTIGFFDGVHRGHACLLDSHVAACKAAGLNSLVVTFSNAPRGFHYPDREWLYLTTPHEKQRLLAKLGIDAVLMLKYDDSIAAQTAEQFLKGLKQSTELRLLTAGYDSLLGNDQLGGQAAYQELTGRLGLQLNYVAELRDGPAPVKSSVARELTFSGRLSEVRQVLGRPYFVIGTVVHGKGKGGSKLGIATANLVLPREKITPPTGVYACVAEVNGERFAAATCVMTKAQANQTVLERGQRIVVRGPEAEEIIIEAHLLNYTGDLYGEPLRLNFISALRGWEEFGTAELLTAQIEADIADTRAALAEEPLLEDNDD